MCKHILFNNFELTDLTTLRQFVSLTNENDGYGAILRTKANALETLKSLNAGLFYLDLVDRVKQGDIAELVVHHRTSTNGVGVEYAHPFEYNGTYLTHNGVVKVPGEHKTNTTNDSEALLHHLVKTGYNTLDIQGYFSCFILDKDTTTVLVDAMAPIYTSDHRVYSSHRLTENDHKIELARITHSALTGYMASWDAIQVTKSTYGYESSHLSLGGPTFLHSLQEYPYEFGNDVPMGQYGSQQVFDFFDMIRAHEKRTLWGQPSEVDAYSYISDLGYGMGLDLNQDDVIEIYLFLEDENEKMNSA